LHYITHITKIDIIHQLPFPQNTPPCRYW